MRYERHQKILELIQEQEIDTQHMLVEQLQKAGFPVTQATVSRDIHDLQLIKTTSSKGKNIYSPSEKSA